MLQHVVDAEAHQRQAPCLLLSTRGPRIRRLTVGTGPFSCSLHIRRRVVLTVCRNQAKAIARCGPALPRVAAQPFPHLHSTDEGECGSFGLTMLMHEMSVAENTARATD